MKLKTLWNKFIVETVGPYSTGLTLEKKFGLESAAVLNHIYKNKPAGDGNRGARLFGIVKEQKSLTDFEYLIQLCSK